MLARLNSLNSRSLALLLVGGLVSAFALAPIPIGLYPDSQDYFDYARLLLGELPVSEFPESRASLRTPVYPVVLALARIATRDWPSAVQLSHLMLLILFLFTISRTLRKSLPILITLAIVAVTLFRAHIFYYVALSEWTAILLSIITYGLYISLVISPSLGKIGALTVGTVLVVLTRPAQLPIVLILPAALLFIDNFRLRAAAIASCSIFALLCWCAVNFSLSGSFTITPFSGISSFGVVNTLSSTPPKIEGDYRVELLSKHNADNFAKLSEPNEIGLSDTTDEVRYNRSVWKIADGLRISQKWSYPELNRVAGTYSTAAIRQNIGGYFQHIFRQTIGARSLMHPLDWISSAITVLMLGIGLRLRSFSQLTKRLAFAGAILLPIGFAQTIFAAAFNVMFYRLFVSIQLPLFFALTVLNICVLTGDDFRLVSRSTNKSEI